jgi:hypothetical protein
MITISSVLNELVGPSIPHFSSIQGENDQIQAVIEYISKTRPAPLASKSYVHRNAVSNFLHFPIVIFSCQVILEPPY